MLIYLSQTKLLSCKTFNIPELKHLNFYSQYNLPDIILKALNTSRTLNKSAKSVSQFGKTSNNKPGQPKKLGRPRKVEPMSSGQPKQIGRPRKLDLISDYTSPTAMHVAQKAKSIQVKSKWWKKGIPVVKVNFLV